VIAAALLASRPTVADSTSDEQSLREVDRLFETQGELPPPSGDNLAQRAERYRELVRARMKQDHFYETVLPILFSSVAPWSYPAIPLTLTEYRDHGARYFGYQHPCAASERIKVRPWWDMATEVLVCRDAYLPDLDADRRLGNTRYCEYSQIPAVDPSDRQCRCGQHLLNCAKDRAQSDAMSHAYSSEVLRTMQWVIQSHRPFSEILLGTSTVRSDLGEFFYARNRFFQTGTFTIRSLDETPSLRPRDPYFDAGILSTPQYIYGLDSHRSTVAKIGEEFLCQGMVSTSVAAKQMFHVLDTQLRNVDHMELTQMVGCRDCHARLENFMTALRPWSNIRNGQRFDPSALVNHEVSFYLRDSTDLRAHGPSTLGWFGRTVGEQPEFSSCMAEKVEELFFAGRPVNPQVHQALVQSFERKRDFADLIERTVVGRYLGAAGLSALP
jgi:hypothetical protein